MKVIFSNSKSLILIDSTKLKLLDVTTGTTIWGIILIQVFKVVFSKGLRHLLKLENMVISLVYIFLKVFTFCPKISKQMASHLTTVISFLKLNKTAKKRLEFLLEYRCVWNSKQIKISGFFAFFSIS